MDIREVIEQINNIDLAEIRIDNIGSWPLAVRIIACLLAFVLAAGGYYYFRVIPLKTQLQNARNQELQLKQDYSARAFQAANLEAYRLQMEELEMRLDSLISQLPSDTEVPDLLEDIAQTGLASGLVIETIDILPDVAHDYYIEAPFNIEARGSYHDFATFVSGVAGLPRIVTLHDLDIMPSNDQLQLLTIEAKTYRYRQPDEELEAGGAGL